MEKWVLHAKKADFKKIGQEFGIDQVTARIIRNRDLINPEEIRSFLYGTTEQLHDPRLLKDADLLTDILKGKIEENKSIRIIGDYDIDGVMSSYILKSALDEVGAQVSVQIPDRVKEGYGLNVSMIQAAIADEIDTILTCDNGISAISEINYAKENGITVLVTDHHEIPFEYQGEDIVYLKSKADAIVNPHQKECSYPYKELCGAGVAWKIIVLLYEKMGKPREYAEKYLENVAFATVGDIMNLTGENRILVKEGLNRIHDTQNIGMRALIAQCGLEKEEIKAYHFGFVLGPCINATGRLDSANRALELLLEKDPFAATMIAQELRVLNQERKDITLWGVERAQQIYQEENYDKDAVVVIYIPEVHESIAGIVAGRIREIYYKPIIILTDAEDGVKGSGRSIEEYSMYDELCKCRELLEKFGGHPMAAGMSLKKENIDAFRQALNKNCSFRADELVEKIKIDVPMPMSYVSKALIQELGILEPFGKGNPKPIFAEKGLSILSLNQIGKNKNVLKLQLKSQDGMVFEAISYSGVDKKIEYLKNKFGEAEIEAALHGQKNQIEIAILYYPKINVFRGIESIQFEVQSIS